MSELSQPGIRFSIITPTFNSEKHLEDTIKSVLNQDYLNIEYIIIDGGSCDHTCNIVDKYRRKISHYISEPDEGIYDAFNKGAKIATGDILYFLNSDDYLYESNVIGEIAEIFNHQPALAFVYGNALVLDEKSNFQYIRGRAMTFQDLKTGEMPPHMGFFARKFLFEKHGFFDTYYKIAGDYDFISKCFQSDEQNSLYINKTIAVFRCGGVSTDPNKQRLMSQEQNAIIAKYFGVQSAMDTLGDINGFYRTWLECLVLQGKGISSVLHQYRINNVAVFGTMKTALCLLADLKHEKINVVIFLDNNRNMQQSKLAGIEVKAPSWLVENRTSVDAIILSIESNRDLEIRAQIRELINDALPVYSWKDLVEQV